jgi:hypothetical protein
VQGKIEADRGDIALGLHLDVIVLRYTGISLLETTDALMYAFQALDAMREAGRCAAYKHVRDLNPSQGFWEVLWKILWHYKMERR